MFSLLQLTQELQLTNIDTANKAGVSQLSSIVSKSIGCYVYVRDNKLVHFQQVQTTYDALESIVQRVRLLQLFIVAKTRLNQFVDWSDFEAVMCICTEYLDATDANAKSAASVSSDRDRMHRDQILLAMYDARGERALQAGDANQALLCFQQHPKLQTKADSLKRLLVTDENTEPTTTKLCTYRYKTRLFESGANPLSELSLRSLFEDTCPVEDV
jgi:hypothetical protein